MPLEVVIDLLHIDYFLPIEISIFNPIEIFYYPAQLFVQQLLKKQNIKSCSIQT